MTRQGHFELQVSFDCTGRAYGRIPHENTRRPVALTTGFETFEIPRNDRWFIAIIEAHIRFRIG